MAPIPNTVYRIETDRTVVRCWTPADAAALRDALDASDAHLRPWIPFMEHEPRSRVETQQSLRGWRASFDRDEHFRFAVLDRTESQLLGEVMLLDRTGPDARELGYWVDARHCGRGYASEAIRALLHVAFARYGWSRLEAHCSPDNTASIRTVETLGFHHEATLARRFRAPNGELQDTAIWTLFAADYVRPETTPRCFDAAGRPLA